MVKYEYVIEELKKEIASGAWKPGDRLPTEHEIAEKYEVSRHTVRQALERMEREKLITSVQGSGTFLNDTSMKNTTNRIGVIVRYINDYIFPEIITGIQYELAKEDYTMLLYSTENRHDAERKGLQACMDQGVDGLIVEATKSARPNPNLDLYKKIQMRGIPVVFIDSVYNEMENTVSVCMNNYEGAARLTKYLYTRGYKHIVALFKEDTKVGYERCRGFIDQQREMGSTVEDDNVIWYTGNLADDLLTPELLDKLLKYDAVICYNDILAYQLIVSLQKRGVRIPEDLAVASFDDTIFSDISPVKITSMAHAKKKAGKIVAKKILALIHGSEEESVRLEWKMVEKEST